MAQSPQFKPSTIVAIDFGTAATGYCIAQIAGGANGAPSSARVFPFRPGDRSSAAVDKNLTSILLDATTMKAIGFGKEARRRFFEMEPEEMQNYLYMEQFKMMMSPTRRGNVPLTQISVHGQGAERAVPLLTAVSKLLNYIKEEAVDRVRSLGVSEAEIGWVLTVPAIWDDEGKMFMRLAAVAAHIIDNVESDRLQLALEPEGAVIAAMMDAPPQLQKALGIGQRVMILDCGGGTVDVTVSELVDVNPPKLKEILPASGGAWGGTYVDAQFRKFANALVRPAGYDILGAAAAATASSSSSSSPNGGEKQSASASSSASTAGMDPSASNVDDEFGADIGTMSDAAALSACMDAWETAKCGWDPTDPAKDRIVVTGLAPVCDFVGGPEEMQRRVAAYNSSFNLTGVDAVTYRPRSFSLVLPARVVRGLFESCVDPICNHMQKLLMEAAEQRRPVGYVFLVGGFAESVYLQRAVRDALETETGMAAHLVVPGKPVQCVNRGASVWGLYPKAFITSRVARYTYAVALNEPYRSAVHDPVPHPSCFFTNASGVQIKNVLVPLVQRNDELPVDSSATQAAIPALDSQTDCSFRIYRLDRRIGALDAYSKRTYLIDDDIVADLPPRLLEPHVHGVQPVAVIDVFTGSKGARVDRVADLSLFFGRTEISVTAVSRSTGKKTSASIKWEGSGQLAVPASPR